MDTAIIILAAGNSSRMGRPKQLLTLNGQTFLAIVTNEALKTDFRPVIIVVGANAEEISQQHPNPKVIYARNEHWQNGMSSSISTGLAAVLNDAPDIENVIIAVADQVHISSDVFEALNKKKQSNHHIVACDYQQTIGTPTLFNKKYFGELLNLKGPKGARGLIEQNIDDTITVPFELGSIDIDTETDYNHLINNK